MKLPTFTIGIVPVATLAARVAPEPPAMMASQTSPLPASRRVWRLNRVGCSAGDGADCTCKCVAAHCTTRSLEENGQVWQLHHEITSFAPASSACGSVSPSALAARRLTTNSNLLG